MRNATAFFATCLSLTVLGCKSENSSSVSTKESADNKAVSTVATEQPTKVDPGFDVELLMESKLSAEDLSFGWIRLFDGQTMMGWEPTSKANWRIEDNALVVDGGEQGFLATKVRFTDFELQLEYKAASTTNSGIFVRSPDKPTSPKSDCYELNIAPKDNPFPTGSIVERVKVEPSTIGELDPETWHTFNALVDHDHIQTWIDGVAAADYTDENKLGAGKILLQYREGPVAFRNIRIRPIGYSILPAAKLDGWRPSDETAFKFERTEEGFIQLEGGRADLELLQQVQNFCLQFQVRTLSEGTNSGVFFRCIPASAMDGYECQVNNLFKGSRLDPVDHGTGGIFRRTPARAVLSNDNEDTFVTVCADGPNISTWVQGIQVVEWTDDRKPHENPRSGYRAEPGTIQLQAHDPTCKVLFKSMLISPIDEMVIATK